MGPTQANEENFDDDETDALEPGQTLMQGQYTVDAFLNAGGFGITYLARNSLGRKIVIKECFPGSFCRRTATSVKARSRSHVDDFASIVRNFVAEAHSLAKVQHPNIVGVHDVFEENQTAYMALDFIEGRDLLDVINEEKDLPKSDQVETIFKKILSAVGHIHEQDLLHRDISPDNILLNSDMEPTLIDFGAAVQDTKQENRILSEMRVIKDGYSPQEFYVSGADQGPFSDLYALAATFYHVITGEIPVNSQTRLAAVATGDADPYVPVVGRLPGYSTPFLQGLDKALAILPKDRINSAALWLDLLNGTDTGASAGSAEKIANVPMLAPETNTKKREAAKKKKSHILAGIGLIVPIIGGVIALQMGGDSAPTEETVAILANAEATQNASLADASVPATEATLATDLGAVLNISAVEPQPDDVSPEATDVATVPTQEDALAGALGLALVDDTKPTSDTVEAGTDSVSAVLGIAPETTALEAALSPAASDLPETSPPLIIESYDLPKVDSAWSVDLTGRLADATDTIYAINGFPVENVAEIDTVINQNMQAPAGDTIELSILAGDVEDTAMIETVTVPVIHRTSFLDGTVFEARMIDGTWTTRVADAPAGSDLQIDDILVGDLGAEVRFDKRTSLPDTLVFANAQNIENLTIAISRQGNMSVASVLVPH